MDHPDEIERLLSEHGDGALPPAEQARLQKLINEDRQMAATARQFDRLNELLKGWRALPAAVDWPSLAKETRQAVSDEAEAKAQGLAGVDRLIREWAGPTPEVDWTALRLRISAAVQQEAAIAQSRDRGRARQWGRSVVRIARVAVPLAAAAVIALMVWWPEAIPTPPGNTTGGSRTFVAVALEVPGRTGQVSVRLADGFSALPGETPATPLVDFRFDEGGVAPQVEAPAETGLTFVVGGRSFDYARVDEADEDIIFY